LVTVGDGRLPRRREDGFSIAEAAPTDQNIAMEAGTLRFGVEKSKIKWGAFFRDLGRSDPATASQFENYSGRGPSVVIHNEDGEKRVLEATKTMKEARERATAIEQDFKTLGTTAWCDRYDVPMSFVTG
jgi:hypothetical protein